MKIFPRNDGAFSLVEVTISLGITAFCLLALFGLLPVGLSSNQASVEQSGAANIATTLVSDFRATDKALTTSRLFKIPLSATHTLYFRRDGKMVGALDAAPTPTTDPFYRAMVEITDDPGRSDAQRPKIVRVLITWPALGDSTPNQAPKNFIGCFETVVALDRSK